MAIVSFSTEAQIVLQPSVDREAAALALGELRLGSGTAIGDAIVRSLETVRPALAAADPAARRPAPSPDDVPATVLLLSDGAQTSGQAEPAQAASLAQRLGVPVNTVALGTAAAVVEVPLAGGLRAACHGRARSRHAARGSPSRPGGRFYEAPDADSLQEVYAELGSRLGSKEEKRELTQVFAAAGGVLLLAGSALSMAWFRRPLVRRLALLLALPAAIVAIVVGCRSRSCRGRVPRARGLPARLGAVGRDPGPHRCRSRPASSSSCVVRSRGTSSRARTSGWPTRISTSSSAARRAARSGRV